MIRRAWALSLVLCLAGLALPAQAETILKTYTVDHLLAKSLQELGMVEQAADTNAAAQVLADRRLPLASRVLPLTASLKNLAPLLPDDSIAHIHGKSITAQTSQDGHAALATLFESMRTPLADEKIITTVTLVEIPFDVVAAEAEFKETASLNDAAVLRLMRAGKGVMMGMSSVTSLHGEPAQTEAGDEVIYPNGFQVVSSTNKNAGTETLVPHNFVTRRTGGSLKITATVGHNRSMIHLEIMPEHCTLIGWTKYRDAAFAKVPDTPEKTKLSQPMFRSFNTYTSVNVVPGEPTVLSGVTHPERSSMIYTVVNARLHPK